MNLEKKILSDITVHMKYARYLEDKNRRENWEELVTRNMKMKLEMPTNMCMIKKFYRQCVQCSLEVNQ